MAVHDPSKKWQQVSVRSASAERMLEILANATRKALMCRDWEDLAEDNGVVTALIWTNWFKRTASLALR